MKKAICLWLLLALAACSSGGGGPAGPTFAVSGTVWLDAPGDDPGEEVEVRAWVDRDGDGVISASESTRTQTGEDGTYSLAAPAADGKKTTLSFTRAGYARQLRTVAAQTGGSATLTVVLYSSASLSCEGAACQDDSGAVRVSGIEIAHGHARVFNPVTEVDAFPGEFADDQGNLLISSVFASFELYDASDKEIRELPAGKKARLEMLLPRDTFGTMGDLIPGTDRIEVPMYSFDEASGQWRADGTGWLEDADGSLIEETDLAGLRDGSFPSQVYVVAEVSHFSYWNCDWPQSEKTVVIVEPQDPEGQPVKNATCFLRGENFPGVSPPHASGTGVECIEVRRSEGPGEDLDGNGIQGEKFRVQIVCIWKDKYYRFPAIELPAESGVCPDGGLHPGPVKLDAEHELQITACTVRGTVMENGQPAAGIAVIAEDPTVPDEIANRVCGGACLASAMSGADGSFEVTTAFGESFELAAQTVRSEPDVMLVLESKQRLFACPSAPVRLHLNVSSCHASLPKIQVDKATNRIAWQPEIKAGTLSAIGVSSAMIKWQIFAEAGFLPPVTYGTVPPGAMQVNPQSGTPPALESGDQVFVVPLGGYLTVSGHRCPASGFATVP